MLVRQGERAGTRSLETISSFDNELWTRATAARASMRFSRGAGPGTSASTKLQVGDERGKERCGWRGGAWKAKIVPMTIAATTSATLRVKAVTNT